MTQISDENITPVEGKLPEEMLEETPKNIPHIPKVSRFGAQPSKFGKNATQNFQNPIQKGRP